MKLLTHDKEELQSTLATQVLEIQHLKEEVEKHTTNSQDLEKLKNELPEIMLGLENIILKLGGSDVVGDQNPAGMKGLLPILEKFVMALILDCENSKSKVHELGSKLLGSQKVVEDLSNKVKSLEESLQSRTAPEIVQERSIFEPPSLPTGSEISEIEDVVSFLIYVSCHISPAGCSNLRVFLYVEIVSTRRIFWLNLMLYSHCICHTCKS